jgi:hypothetical protein
MALKTYPYLVNYTIREKDRQGDLGRCIFCRSQWSDHQFSVRMNVFPKDDIVLPCHDICWQMRSPEERLTKANAHIERKFGIRK